MLAAKSINIDLLLLWVAYLNKKLKQKIVLKTQ